MKTNLTKWLEINGNPNPKLPVPNKEELENLYNKNKMSQRELAKYYKVTQTQIRRWMKEYSIKSRSLKEAHSGGPGNGKENFNWKGDSVGYSALHSWIRKNKGTPKKCEHCGRTDKKKYEWANISGEYKRDLNDWIRLCTKCHREFDKK